MILIKKNIANLVILLLLGAGVWIRATWYGDLRLSIANAETDSYINSSKASVLSWKIFAGQRLFTTNLIYKMANDSGNCPITSYGKPGVGEEDVREIQPCFDKIAILQNVLSIFGWAFLAWMVARWMKNPLTKIAAALIIMGFGFTPQIAEWDSILSPESLSLSLFAILLGTGLEVAFRIAHSEAPFKSKWTRFLFILWMILFLLWVFVRDVHLYAIPVLLILVAPLLFIKKNGAKYFGVALGVLVALLLVGYLSARDSYRATRFPIINAIDAYIWPYPARVEFFRQFEMPERDDAAYQEWADEHATKAYGLFLVSHPGFVVTTLWENLDHITDNFIQPYFFTDEVKNRDTLLVIGEILHPETPALYLITALAAAALFVQALQRRNPALSVWAWFSTFVFLAAAATLFLSYFGDTAGTRRHIMPSVETFRLYLWVFLMPLLDLSLSQIAQKD